MMAKQFNIPASPTVYSAVHTNFTGCDYTTDAMTVDDRRFPDAQNLMLDIAGYPEKRPGFRRVFDAENKEIKMMRRFVVAGTSYYFIFAGDCVYIRCNHMTFAVSGCKNVIEDVLNCVFAFFSDSVYIFVKHTGSYKIYTFSSDEEGNVRLEDDALSKATVPTTSVVGHVLTEDNLVEGVEPSAGFESLEPVNLLTTRRTNTFKIEEGFKLTHDDNATEYSSFVLEKPMYFYCDTSIELPEQSIELPEQSIELPEKTKIFIEKLYLRLFYSDPDATVFSYSATSVYAKAWEAVYGENWESYYKAYLEKVGGKITQRDFLRKPFFSGVHAEEIYNFLYSSSSPLVSLGGYSNGNCESFGLNEETSMFGIEIYLTGIGFVKLPMVAATKEFHRDNSNETATEYRVWLYWHLAAELDSDDIIDGKRLSLFRLGHPGHINKYPGKSYIPDTTVPENVRITFLGDTAERDNNLEKIFGAENSTMYGVLGNADRLFIAGNGKERNYVRYSEMSNPLYFPDLNYIVAGASNTKVVSMFPSSGSLVIAKEPNGQDVNMFLASGGMSEGQAVFTVSEGLPGTGVIAPKAVRYVDDLPHFLSDNGVFSLISNNLSSRMSVVNRSFFCDRLLMKEKHPEKACMAFYKKMLMVAYPDSGNCYVFNTKDKTYSDSAGSTHYVYECWRWTNIHATCFLTDGEHLYFGTPDLGVMKFNFDLDAAERYNDFDVNDGKGKAIDAYFKTKTYTDGSFMALKNMRKRGCGIVLKPFVRSSCDIAVMTDSFGMDLKSVSADIFDWKYIDFERIDFSSNPEVRVIPFNQKVKKYATIQFIVKNSVLNESFGVIGIEKAYTIGNFKKS